MAHMVAARREYRVALAHDWLVGLRGGERVLDRLAKLFGPTEIYTLVSNGRSLTEAISACRTVTSPLQRFPGASGSARRHYLPLMPWAVDRLRIEPCDIVVSTSSAVMKSIRPPQGVPHLCYCHTPARYVWGQRDAYAVGSGGRLRRIGLAAVRRPFQRWDRATADRVTVFCANSAHTAREIMRCYGREATVVHPPVRTDWYTPDPGVEREGWLLVVAALEPYKRTDLAVEAATRAGFSLKVAGGGTQLDALRREAGSNVELLGEVDDHTLRDLYRRARGLVFPQVEDFGLVAVEAQAAGCPVIAFAAGGALETVTPHTGVFFEEQTVEGLLEAIERFDNGSFDAVTCRANAARFSEERFDERIVGMVEALLA